MGVAMQRPGVTVGRLRILGGPDPLATRLAADRILGAAELFPRGLGPAAVLVVRRLADPWPGHLDLRAQQADPSWAERTRGALDDCAARAARPWRGAVPAGAQAVVFQDQAELLACLLIDATRGLLGDRWYWRVLGLERADSVTAALATRPECLPAVFARLLARHAGAAVASWMSPAVAVTLIEAMCAAFGVPAAARAALQADPAPGPGAPPSAARKAQSPWAHLLPAEGAQLAGLDPAQEALAGLAAMLANEPLALRAASALSQTAHWRAARSVSEAVAGPGADLTNQVREDRPTNSSTAGTLEDRKRRATGTGGSGTPADWDRAAPGPESGSRPGSQISTSLQAHGIGRDGSGHALPTPHPTGPVKPARAEAGALDPLQVVAPRPSAQPLAQVATELGGLFHLVYLAQRLELYGDFTEPARPGIDLGIWDLVTLVGAGLLGQPSSHGDPVWRLLADLAGRSPDQPAGGGFRPPRVWRVPRSWLDPVPTTGDWMHFSQPGRLVLRHPCGFAVIDGRADLARELRRYGVKSAVADPGRPVEPGRGARKRWVANLVGYLRCRLAAATGVAESAASGLVLARPALVSVTSTRVDVVSELADLPIEVRLAGIDRDPGFVPAAGRSIYFHFR